MGIVGNAKKAIKNKLKSALEGSSNMVSKAAVLSPKDAEILAERRDNYYKELDEKTGAEVLKRVDTYLGEAAVEIHQAYLSRLKDLYVPIDLIPDEYNSDFRIRSIDIT